MNEAEKQQAWLAFASSALAGMGASSSEKADLDDIAEDACRLADAMLDAYRARYDPTWEDEEDEEEDEEEERPRRARPRTRRMRP